VTPETLAELAKVDHTLAEGLVELYRSPPIPNAPLVATGEVSTSVIDRVIAAFAAMDKDRTGRATLRLLDYSGWSAP
jgi:ABC-type phosphate/phosphonate transport system substrate-binding protein